MDQEASHQIEQRLAELPEDVRNAVLSVEWEGKVQAIAQKHTLHIDQAGALGDLTLMTMLGLSSLADFGTQIGTELKVPQDKAAQIAEDISHEVFMPIQASLRAFTEGKAAAPAPVAAPLGRSPATGEAKPDLSAAESMLSAKAVSTPPPAVPAATPTTPATPATPAAPIAPLATGPTATEPPKPGNYSTDPYREPPV